MSSRLLKCPECGAWINLDDCVYTNVAPTEDPMIMVYAPTCECGGKIKDKDYLLYPTKLPHSWIGGLRLDVLQESKRSTT